MSSLVETVAFVFALVALGYLSGWSGLLKKETGTGLSDFAVSVAMPLLLFRTMAQADFGGGLPLRLWGTYFAAAIVTWLLAQLVIVHIFGRDARAAIVGGLSASFSNLALLGIPLILGVFGHDGFAILSLILSIHLPLMVGASTALLSWFGGKGAPHGLKGVVRDFAVNIAGNPLMIGIAAGLLWRVTGLEMPLLASRLVDALADVAAPVALFAMGLGLLHYGISGNVRPAVAIAAFKLLFMPALVLLLASMTGLSGISAKVAVTAASMPLGVNPYLVAVRFGTGQALASNSMSISTALAAFTTAGWVAIAQWIFG
ncbi:AEC family transporter [Chelativorans sp. J32]|uniref:AEC family transporter n=1 Tax=Chelativorans sp. J32 TaxID=935840 RepID=UPI0004803C30|nr:AEC family transporter [Chelativorans sp. J32]